jgi:hypothetical protein
MWAPSLSPSVELLVVSRRLNIFLRLLPVLDPPCPPSSTPSSVGARCWLAHGSVLPPSASAVHLFRLIGQFVLVDDATLLIAGVLLVRPRLLLPWRKDSWERARRIIQNQVWVTLDSHLGLFIRHQLEENRWKQKGTNWACPIRKLSKTFCYDVINTLCGNVNSNE